MMDNEIGAGIEDLCQSFDLQSLVLLQFEDDLFGRSEFEDGAMKSICEVATVIADASRLPMSPAEFQAVADQNSIYRNEYC